MYCPAHFREDDPAALRGLIEQFPLGAVICQGADGLVADHIPLLHEAVPDGLGRLVGHVAKSNPAGLEIVRTYAVADSATWAQPTISGNRLFVKDLKSLALWTVN